MILFLLPALLGGAGVLPAGAAPDLAFDTSWIEEDCGSDLSCSEQTATMRLAAGGRLRWRLAAGGVRALAPAGLARTLAGPVPIDRGQVQRRAGGGTSGGGSGAKGSHAMESTSSLASPSIEAGDGVWITGFDDVDLGLDARVAGGGSRPVSTPGSPAADRASSRSISKPTSRPRRRARRKAWAPASGTAGSG